VEFSKSGNSIYFNGHTLKGKVHGLCHDLESRKIYWVSGIKKNGKDRHWAGNGKIMIDKEIVADYLKLSGLKSLDLKKYELVTIKQTDKKKFAEIENRTLE
jgi:hypothetical protein